MSQENLDLVRRVTDGIDQGEENDLSGFHPDVEFIALRTATEGAYHGLAGIERFIADTRETFEKFEPHIEFLDLGDRVLAWGTIHLRARGSGIETDIPTGGVYDFRDGKIVRWEDFGSKQRALEALGLEE